VGRLAGVREIKEFDLGLSYIIQYSLFENKSKGKEETNLWQLIHLVAMDIGTAPSRIVLKFRTPKTIIGLNGIQILESS
jgi:hypothetical protein